MGENATEPDDVVGAPEADSVGTSKPSDTSGDAQPEPEETSGDAQPEPEETSGDAQPEPEETSGDAQPEPEETSGDAQPEPEETSGDAQPEPEETSGDAQPEPEETSGDAQPEPEETHDIIFVGGKPIMTYVNATLTLIKSTPVVTLMARGHRIKQAVDVALTIVKRMRAVGYVIGDVRISSNPMESLDGKSRNISTIEIEIQKSDS